MGDGFKIVTNLKTFKSFEVSNPEAKTQSKKENASGLSCMQQVH